MKAFFDHETLHAWWQASHSATTPRTLGVYAIERPPTDFHDDILGRLGGVFRGTVVKCQVGEGFLSPTRSGCRRTAIPSDRWRSRSP